MLKATLDNLDGLSDDVKSFYVEADGKYQLQVDGLEDTGALKRAKEHEKQARKDAETKNSELQAQLDELTKKLNNQSDDDARKKGDIDALEKSWQEKHTSLENDYKAKLASSEEFIQGLLVDGEANRLAAEIGREGAGKPLARLIKDRLTVDERDGKPATVVLDENGKPSALTIDELKQQLRDDPALAGLVAGSKANGGGAPSGKGGGASHGGDLSKMSRAEKLEHFRNLE